MTREQFKECIRKVEGVNEIIDNLDDLGISIMDCPEVFASNDVFMMWVLDEFGEEGEDLVYWWVYEDVDKIIYEPDGTETNLENIDDLYTYLDENYRKTDI